jgi:hypothetical protein
MSQSQKFLLRHEKQINRSLAIIGILFIFIGIFVDLSWLKSIGNSYAVDGACEPFEILDSSLVIFPIIGSAIFIFSIKYFNDLLLNKTKDLKTILKFAVFFMITLYLISSQIRYFDNDEYEHLHKAWLMIEGSLPYFSITFVHMPLLQWIIVLFMQLTGESTTIIQTMRIFMFFLSCGSLYLIYIITKELFNSKTNALLAILLIIGNLVWIRVSPEIRPDNIMVFFVLLSFWILIQYYKNPKAIYLLMFILCAFLSMLGKQNAAIFYFAVGGVFGYDSIIRKKLLNTKKIVAGIIILIILFQIDIIREFFLINTRHLIPNEIKFFPNYYLKEIWRFNPAIFLLFILQLFSPIKLNKKYEIFKKYLIAIFFTLFIFLFLMNRPFMQEMIVMIIFMSIFGSNILSESIRKLNRKLCYFIIGIIIVPALICITHNMFYRSFTNDIETTKTILKISDREDLVFDSYGKAIFRHHPLDPKFLIYFPAKFNRLDEVKKSNVKYLIKDYYYSNLEKNSLDWFERNFIQTNENPNIFIRINHIN